MGSVSILIIDDDKQSQAALQHVLDSEGWKLSVVPLAEQALDELARGNWTVVIVNVAMTGLSGPLFTTLKELAHARAVEAGHRRVRVLFLVPELVAEHAQQVLDRERLPFALTPIHLHDFLEKLSDLLLEAQAIPRPIAQVHYNKDRRQKQRRGLPERRKSPMFASRDAYFMTEEEIAEFEKQEEEERTKKAKKEREPLKTLLPDDSDS